VTNSLGGHSLPLDDARALFRQGLTEVRQSLTDRGWRFGRSSAGGSLRRGEKSIVGDLDAVIEILGAPDIPIESISDWGRGSINTLQHDLAVRLASDVAQCVPRIQKAKAMTVGAHMLLEGIQLDIFPALSDNWTASRLFWTGSRYDNQFRMQNGYKSGFIFGHEGIYDRNQRRLRTDIDEDEYLTLVGLKPLREMYPNLGE
jgi:DNA polymerase/3'-5' exonuclease PolX